MGVSQLMVSAYGASNRAAGKNRMRKLIDSLAARVPSALVEIGTLGQTLKTNEAATSWRTSTARAPATEPPKRSTARLEHLRGSALGFSQPHQLHRQTAPGGRRVQTGNTPSMAMSPSWLSNQALDQLIDQSSSLPRRVRGRAPRARKRCAIPRCPAAPASPSW